MFCFESLICGVFDLVFITVPHPFSNIDNTTFDLSDINTVIDTDKYAVNLTIRAINGDWNVRQNNPRVVQALQKVSDCTLFRLGQHGHIKILWKQLGHVVAPLANRSF